MKRDIQYEYVEGYGWDRHEKPFHSRELADRIKTGRAHKNPISQEELVHLLEVRDHYLLAAEAPEDYEEAKYLLEGERNGTLCQLSPQGGPLKAWRDNAETMRHGFTGVTNSDEQLHSHLEHCGELDVRERKGTREAAKHWIELRATIANQSMTYVLGKKLQRFFRRRK